MSNLTKLTPKLHQPWLVAVWPGMGHVAMAAGFYLVAKLKMEQFAEISPQGLFEVDHAVVEKGLIRLGSLPSNRLFAWKDPAGQHDLVVFIGEAQPQRGRQAFCQMLVGLAKELGVERVFTFASLATPMRPENPSRIFGAATDANSLATLQQFGVQPLDDGQVSGLNGVLLGVAAENQLPGSALFGEMPHIFPQVPYPAAALKVLETFTRMSGIALDTADLAEQSADMNRRLSEFLAQLEQNAASPPDADDEDDESWKLGLESSSDDVPSEEFTRERLSAADQRRIEQLFDDAHADRAKAIVLKRELDRLDAFAEYEDRFLDLFKTAG
ncbi:MAG: PAC2 family protein [Pirellulaceae bacterium]|nr:PAC2 family protein [Pirellulaceae bacterium]